MRFMYIVTSSQPPRPDAGPHGGDGQARRPGNQGGPHDRQRRADAGSDRRAGAITDGKLSVIDGPFVETKELIGGYAIFELRNKEEAVAAAVEFMQLHREHMPGWEGIRRLGGILISSTSCQIGSRIFTVGQLSFCSIGSCNPEPRTPE